LSHNSFIQGGRLNTIRNYFEDDLVESFTINQDGIILSSSDHLKIRRKLQALEFRAPAMSSIHFNLKKYEDKIEGTMLINSYIKNFNAHIHGDCPLSIYNELEKNIEYQLINWKRSRFITRSYRIKN
jgi:hypothetical protein